MDIHSQDTSSDNRYKRWILSMVSGTHFYQHNNKEEENMLKFYTCRICGNLIEMIEDTGVIPNCCGDDMDELIPGTTDGAKEKHIPVYTISPEIPGINNEKLCTEVITVKVGEEPHPMNENHSINWIVILTDKGVYRKNLDCCQEAQTDFCLKKDETLKAIYAYCNLHGLWVNIIND